MNSQQKYKKYLTIQASLDTSSQKTRKLAGGVLEMNDFLGFFAHLPPEMP